MEKKYILSLTNYELLKSLDMEEMGDNIRFLDNENLVYTTDLRTLLLIIDDEITYAGLTDDQEQCNEYGRRLYSLYDELYYQG